jgi:hypothetical protein
VPTLRLKSSLPARTVADPYEPRVAIWREDCAETCLHIIVANVMTHTPVSFTLELTGPIWESLAVPNATRIFDGQYTIPIVSSAAAGQAGGILSDWVDAGGTNVVRTQAICQSVILVACDSLYLTCLTNLALTNLVWLSSTRLGALGRGRMHTWICMPAQTDAGSVHKGGLTNLVGFVAMIEQIQFQLGGLRSRYCPH